MQRAAMTLAAGSPILVSGLDSNMDISRRPSGDVFRPFDLSGLILGSLLRY
jgi:hypothetical protein